MPLATHSEVKEKKLRDDILAKIGEMEEFDAIRSQLIMSSEGYRTKEWHNLLRRARRNGYSLCKQILVDYIKAYVKMNGKLSKNHDYILEIKLEPCGTEAKYKTFDDIPNESVICSCGNPNHYLIRYIDQRN